MAIATFAVGGEQKINVAFPIPDRYKLINDYGNVLLIATSVKIDNKLRALEKRNGTQIVFLSVPHVGEEGVYAYAGKVFKKWDIGNNGQGNGVLFLVSSEGSYILTGPGIAGAIPDVKVGRIFRGIISPLWQREKYSEGVEAGIDALIQAAKGEDTAPTAYDYAHPIVPTTSKHFLIAALALSVAGYAAVLGWRYRGRQKQMTS